MRKSDEGQALVLAALGLVVLMLMAGLGVDVGYLRYEKQQMQKAADAGAIAGAAAYLYEATWKTAAQNDTSANGFTNGNNGIVVLVNTPWEGPFAGQAGYVEVSVSKPEPTFFMRVGGFTSVPVRSWAVANANGKASECIIALDPLASESFKAAGSITLSSQCGIRVDSTSSTAYTDNGSACVTATTDGIGVSGGVENTQSCSTIPQTNMAPVQDPFHNLVEPTTPRPCDYTNWHWTGGPVTLNPGTYCGGITINGSASIATFNPGLYILQGGGMTINATSVIHGTGVTFYNTFDSSGRGFGNISINGVSNSNLSAPTNSNDPTGAPEGILFFEDRLAPAKTNNTIDGGSGTTFDGSLYFFASSLNFSGSSSVNGYSIIVADQISVTGASSIKDNYSSLADGPPIKAAVVAE